VAAANKRRWGHHQNGLNPRTQEAVRCGRRATFRRSASEAPGDPPGHRDSRSALAPHANAGDPSGELAGRLHREARSGSSGKRVLMQMRAPASAWGRAGGGPRVEDRAPRPVCGLAAVQLGVDPPLGDDPPSPRLDHLGGDGRPGAGPGRTSPRERTTPIPSSAKVRESRCRRDRCPPSRVGGASRP